MTRLLLIVSLGCWVSVLAQDAAPGSDVVLRALTDELERSRELRVVSLEQPYYIEYGIHETETFSASATLGALNMAQAGRVRLPRVQVRVGDYAYDNGNYVLSDYAFSSRYDLGGCPIDDNYAAIRQYFWLATDSAYKSALEAIARKRASQKNVTITDPLPDFSKVEPVTLSLSVPRRKVDEEAWKSRVRALSALFASQQGIIGSSVEYYSGQGFYYLVTSEGTRLRVPESSQYLQARATALAPDGMTLRDSTGFYAVDANSLPAEGDLRRGIEAVIGNLGALLRAPVAEPYTGPVLFEPAAAAQLMAEVLGRSFALRRRPVSEPGRTLSFVASELEGRLGSRILPEWMEVVDDPTAADWRGQRLLGQYPVDLEGVIPKPLTLVDKGLLRNYLSTRQPVKGALESNGRARLLGGFGANAASFSNLFVRASETSTLDDLKKKLIEIAVHREKPYGLLVRKMDFPSAASVPEAQRLLAAVAQDGASARAVSLPVLVYRVYPDGREELVRGLRFKELTLRSLRDILAAGGEPAVFNYLENGAPFALLGAASYVAESSVVSPGLLFEELQLVKAHEDMPRLPIVPPPANPAH
ncbi:MAG: metallopeptidase TldD-related protein [Bryobacteraceae bacterium]